MSLATTSTAPRQTAAADAVAAPIPRPPRVVWVVALLAVLVRLPFVARPAEPDEAGFLQVAKQWAAGGGSLYGKYWVDRPPMLITLFRLADLTGGLVALRLLGCVAVAAAVLLSARAARLLAGERAASWTAGISAALLVSPLMGSLEVNGELLSAPLVALAVLVFIQSSRSSQRQRALGYAALGGAAGVCAVLIKQNILDALVFGLVLLAASHRSLTTRGALERAAAAVAGGGVTGAAVAAWTVLHGTSLVGVFDAMYPFRLRAAQVVAANGSQYADGRAVHLLLAWIASGTGILTVAVLTGTRRRLWTPATIALAATLAYDALSIGLGGGYWAHYLVEMVVPLSIWAGIVTTGKRAAPRLAALLAVVVSAITLLTASLTSSTPAGQQVGAAIGQVARPGDTLTVLYGDPQVNRAAGLTSPYPYLWSLPIKTLDPHLTDLDSVLSSPQAPTWLVVSHGISSWGLETGRTQALINTDYTSAGEVDGQQVYLHDGVDRPLLPQSTTPVP